LISKRNTYKLGDLGQSRIARKTSDDIEEGDSRYLARELLQEDQTDLTKADIFSLGMTLYEIITSRSSFLKF
jgi:Protein kinase domain.